jgi:hypothetical protein
MGTYRITGYVGKNIGPKLYPDADLAANPLLRTFSDLYTSWAELTASPAARKNEAKLAVENYLRGQEVSWTTLSNLWDAMPRSPKPAEAIAEIKRHLDARNTAIVQQQNVRAQEQAAEEAAAAAAEAAKPKGMSKYMGQAAELAKNKKVIIAASLVGAALLAWLVSRRK